MAKLFSEAKSVRLPKEKVQVNYVYTQYQDISGVQELVTDSLTAFGEWGNDYLNVWVCQNDREWIDMHTRLIPDVSEYDLRSFEEPLNQIPIARMIYSTNEVQKLIGIRSEKLLKPNLLLHNNNFSKADKKAKSAFVKHEFSHKFEMDYGYFTPIMEKFKEIYFRHSPLTKNQYIIFKNIEEICDDISADEVCIDFGFKDDVFVLANYNFKSFRPSQNEIENSKPLDWFLPVLGFSSYPVVFSHKNEEGYATKLRKVLDEYLKKVKVIDCVALRKDFEATFDRVRNPPHQSELEVVYSEIVNKLNEVSRLET
jgi:hypothetical protein